MSTGAVQTIRFSDQGQDFLEWDLDASGQVVGCRPFQAEIWCSYRVVNHAKLSKGSKVLIQIPNTNIATAMKYPLRSIHKVQAQSEPSAAVLNSKVVARGAKALLASYKEKEVSV